MKCTSCGAEIKNSKFCEFCGSQINQEMQKVQEQLNMKGCPKCGSSNISFRRENQGEIRGKNVKQVVHRTVGVCKDCGNTWFADGSATLPQQKRKTWLWVMGWIFIFPVPLTILMLRKNDMKPALKYGIIAAAWIVYLIIGFSGQPDKTTDTAAITATKTAQEIVVDDTVKEKASEG